MEQVFQFISLALCVLITHLLYVLAMVRIRSTWQCGFALATDILRPLSNSAFPARLLERAGVYLDYILPSLVLLCDCK